VLLACTAAAVATLVATRRSPNFRQISEERVLEELTEALQEVLTEMAQMATRVRQVLAMKGMAGQISEQEISDIILSQGISEKLDEAQTRVLARHGISEDEIVNFRQISDFNAGFQEMFECASRGDIPVLPNFQLPEELNSPDKMIDYLLAMGERKIALFREIINPRKHLQKTPEEFFADPVIGELLQKANERAEQDVIARLGPNIGRAKFYSAMGVFSRDRYFSDERKKIDRSHQVEIMKLVSQEGETNFQVHPGVHPLIRPAGTAETLPVLLMEATDVGVCVVVALVKPEIANEKVSEILRPLSETVEGIMEEFAANNKQPLFAYMKAEKDSPLVQHEKCADKEVVYVVFARPDVAKRPIACLSLEELMLALRELNKLHE
jgi:phosphopantetheine adenylyltransferase